MRSVLFVFLCFLHVNAGATCTVEKIRDYPKVRVGEKYSKVRQQLIAAGWTPYKASHALPCESYDLRCKDRPEMIACSGVELGPCGWLWKKNRMMLVVSTLADTDDEIFQSISQYHGCD